MLETLERGTEAILTSEGYRSFLRMQGLFWSYSFANTLLIMTQRPGATRVNSYRRWGELGRQVQRGEAGIKVFYPVKGWETDPETGRREEVVRGFGVGSVFDVAQTRGDPLPEPPPVTENTTTSDASVALHLKLSRWLVDQGVTLAVESTGRAGGYWDPATKTIAVSADTRLDPFSADRTGTLVHEAAHYLADHRGNVARDDAETVAESTAFVVLDHFGVDTAESSFPYVAGWAKDKEVLRRNLGEIQKLSGKLIGMVEGAGDPFGEGVDDFLAKDPWEELRRLTPEDLELPYPPSP